VYVNPNFSGESASFRSDTPNLVPSGLNDQVSSIRIPNGETWEMCQDVDYGNQCQSLSSSVSDLRSIGWDNRISSLRRTDGNGGFGDGRYRGRRSDGGNAPSVQQRLVFYDRPGYKGTFSSVTSGSTTAFSAKQGSVQLRGGGTWELCNESGRCATIDQDVSKMSQLKLNGRITSARLVNDSQDRRNRGGERIR
jgi:hypothetical protein